jgi:hypothetical protein
MRETTLLQRKDKQIIQGIEDKRKLDVENGCPGMAQAGSLFVESLENTGRFSGFTQK